MSPGAVSSSAAFSDFVPAWVGDALMYHIYPLGFLNAPARNPGTGEPVPRLLDLRDWYDHITGLGVNTIMLGPVWESGSHGYDTTDLKRVDRRLGDIQHLRTVIDELHQRGIRVLLDGVFNHTGRHFFAFDDLRARGKRSPYQAWYRIDLTRNNRHNDGFQYKGWHGSLSLPELNLRHEAVRQYLCEVAQFWLAELDIDGYRLDAAADVPTDFWRDFRHACKRVKPDCFLFGELVFGEYEKYLGPNGLDGATHYPLYDAIVRSFEHKRFGRVARLLRQHRENPRHQPLISFLGNHDVTRIRTRLSEPAHYYPATLLLMTLPFVPCLYYGDECGMTGDKHAGDAALRQPMPEKANAASATTGDRYHTIARLAAMRQAHPILRFGHIAFVRAQQDRLAFGLKLGQARALIAVNAGQSSRPWHITVPDSFLPAGTQLHDPLHPDLPAATVGKSGSLNVEPLYPMWGRALLAADA